jgi:hypothetical protein
MPMSVSRECSRLFRRTVGRGGEVVCFATPAIAGIMLLASHPTIAATWDSALNEPALPFASRPDNRWQTDPTPGQPTLRLNTSFGIAPLGDASLALSPVERRVSLIAWHNGDRDFLMVDKNRGKIILFENGRPIFSRPALTGESMADRIPADAWTTPWARQIDVKFKVTPAGRFTITRNHDNALGELFDINEMQGRDWTLAIHRVWLGKASERRDARLRSDMDEDKHITNGCVDVDPSTMAFLTRVLPNRGMPLYILPSNENLISDVFEAGTRRAGPRS